MLDQSLLQSHFIGRDGFRWWIGQVPPVKEWSDQADYKGWGLRVKVRILGYHPLDSSDLSDENLPWAQVMLPTTAGSGAANFAQPPKISQGDMVIGFFLDGDNAQIPVIMGLLGRTSEWSTSGYKNPFTPFTGYTTNIPKPNGRLKPDQTNENRVGSQESPVIVDPKKSGDKIPAYAAVGSKVVFADTCGDTSFKTIKNELNNLLKFLQDAQNTVSDISQRVNAAVDVITASINWVVGKMFDYLFKVLCGDENKEGLIPAGLNALYKTVFGSTLAATGNPGVAHQAGVSALEPFVPAVNALEDAIACVAANIMKLLKSIVRQLLNSLIQNVKNLVSCVVEQFLGTLVNSIVQAVADGLSTALSGVTSLLGAAFNVVDILQESVDAIKSIGGLFDCNQENTKCSGVKEWTIGYGAKSTADIDLAFENILQNVNNISGAALDLASAVNSTYQSIDAITNAIDVFDPTSAFNDAVNSASACFYGQPTTCGTPTINLFGGGGTGATAIPIFGSITPVQQIQDTISNVQNTASIIGAIVTNGGSGYTYPPSIEITDSCDLGYGAVAQSVINENGEVTSVYIVSPGEGYPLGDQDTSGVVDVYVESPGSGYSVGDTATDNLGNTYSLTTDNGAIVSARPINIVEATELPVISVNSSTGSGAILRPIFGSIANMGSKEIKKQIDCII